MNSFGGFGIIYDMKILSKPQQRGRMVCMRYFAFLFIFVCFVSTEAFAQYRGGLQFQNKPGGAAKDLTAPPVAKVFSSKVSSAQQAEKLDIILNNLYVSLWNFAGSDFVYQRQLYDLLKFERFKLTRYAAEFSGPMDSAMGNLNENYQKMKDEIALANQDFANIKEGIREEDYEVLDPLWEEEIAKLEAFVEEYFKMQHDYLRTYNKMVNFIIKQGGSYYYKPGSRSLHFYKNQGKVYFGKTYDRLRKISYDQRQHLRSKPPAGADPSYIE